MPDAAPDDAIATALAGAAGLGASWIYNSGTPATNNVFIGPLRPQEQNVPANAIFVMATGGRQKTNFLGGRAAGSIYNASVQVIVRGGPNDWKTTRELAQSVRDLIDKNNASGGPASLTSYVFVTAIESEPNYIGLDDAKNHLFSVNFDIRRSGTP